MPIESHNPTTGARFKTFQPYGPPAVEKAVARAAEAFREHRRTSHAERGRRLEHVARILEQDRKGLAQTMTAEMGKPLTQAEAEIEKCAWVCRYYAEEGPGFLAEEEVETDARRSVVRYEPLGPILAIMPWNFPFWQVFRFAAPSLMAGNVALLKHAPNVPRCALALEDVFRRGGWPDGSFQNLFLEVDQVGELIADDRIRGVTVTGSPGAGSAVAERAGRALKKTVLELGGSDPFIVMPSADLERAVQAAVRARTQNSGQSCIAAKRFILHESVAAAFRQRFVVRMEDLTVGDPMEEETEVGPLAREDLLETLEEQVRRTAEAGATVLTGGDRLQRSGWFYAPTVLDDVPEGTPAREEELFGPVAVLLRVPDVAAAVELANETSYGLGASVWTEDEDERRRFTEELEAGVVFVNGMTASDPRLPFGGVKRSGYGRELGRAGIREFVNVKTVVEEPSAADGEEES